MNKGTSLSRILKGGLLSQVLIMALLSTTLVLVLFGLQRIQNQTEILRNNLQMSLQEESEWLATGLGLPLYHFDEETVTALCSSILRQTDILQINLDANNKKTTFFAENTSQDQTVNANTISIVQSINYQSTYVGTIEILASTDRLEQQIKKTIYAIIWRIAVLDIVLVAVIVFFLSRKFVAPIGQLQSAAQRIAKGDLDHIISVKSDNELGLLAQNLETMRQTLKAKIGALKTEIDQRKKTEKELFAAKNYIDNIINSMPSQLIGVDAETRVTQWNRQVENVSGLSSEEVLGKKLQDVLPRLAGDVDKIDRAMVTKEVFHEDARSTTIDKYSQYEDITIYPLVANGVIGAVIRVDDVTEEYLMREELTHSRKLDAVGQLAGGIAHDFNNMLAGILGSAELLLRRVGQDEKAGEYLDMIIQSGRRAGELNKKLLTFARKGKVELLPIDALQVIYDTEAILKHSLDKRITIETIVLAENTAVIGDPAQLQNAFINLGVNAGHAMSEGGTLCFTIDTMELDQHYCNASHFDIKPGKYLNIQVKDDGEGIPLENLKRIFDPFFTTRKRGKGTGLGLSAVYGTVQEHHGAIVVYSEPGRGTCFSVYLPLVGQEPVSQYQDEELIMGSGTILVIDDEEVIRVTAKTILESLGYKVLLGENGQHGLEIFTANAPDIDLVLLDMIMPKMNGRECFFAMKKIKPDIRVLLASGFSRDSDIEGLQAEGLLGFLYKPYITAELSRAIAEILQPSTLSGDQ